MTAPRPRGRFAPSPTGPLHFGSLIAAVGSRLQALSRGGTWHLRIDDIDPPREVPGASDAILRALDAYGLHWDGDVLYQSRRHAAYAAALAQLAEQGLTYPCSCSRREITALAAPGPAGPVYPGHCRHGPRNPARPLAVRVRVPDREVCLEDGLFGPCRANLALAFGDFVVRRADGLYAYHLATVVDDAWLGITEIVRGADLLDLSLAQNYLAELLGHRVAGHLHLPLAIAADGQKLSKQNGAQPLPDDDPRPSLVAVLEHLGQGPPPELCEAHLDDLWRWAIDHWDPGRLACTPRPPPTR